MNRQVDYRFDPEKDLTFIIYNYNYAFPFSSFLPGIAGILGIPMWCFYVNRGQCIASFGFETKDGAILEFHPANKAYRLTPIYGFRTFIKIEDILYEPFSERFKNFEIENKMSITPYDLTIYEINKNLNLSCEVNYFTLPSEPVGALIRIFNIRNLSKEKIKLKIIDGLPQFLPYGLTNEVMKNMSRTIEAWYRIDNLEENLPYYRLSTSFQDVAEVKPIEEGHFYFAFSEEKNLLPVVIDPDIIFFPSSDFSYPWNFSKKDFELPKPVYYGNRTPSAFSYISFDLDPFEERAIISFFGRANSLSQLKELVKKYTNIDFVKAKAEENKLIIREITDKAFVYTSVKEFNSYVRQSFLDNVLRGGLPVSIEYENKKDVIYLFSRKHGDLERDYNFFRLEANYFSQGNANFRDINQNRRNDIYFNPNVGHFNILYFMNLIQLDGYNPLLIKGVKYIFEKEKEKLSQWVDEDVKRELEKVIYKPYIPYDVIKILEKNNFKLKKGDIIEFISFLLVNSKKTEDAEFGEGYWIDHWFYNLDLIESFESIFPDKMEDLLLNIKEFTYYDNYERVLPREERYILTEKGVRQYRALFKDEEKLRLINSRNVEPYKVRKDNGRGEIYYTNLFSKLITLVAIKYSTLDPDNIGIEMEAGRPGWNDALNGLPGIFGSSVNETFELKRLILMIKKWVEKYNLEEKEINLPIEVYSLLNSLMELTIKNLDEKISNFEFWDKISKEREIYREKIRFGIEGKEISIKISDLLKYLNLFLEKIERGLKQAFNPQKGIYYSYFYYELIDYEIIEKDGKLVIKPKKFERKNLPSFLESQVHFLKSEEDIQKKIEIIENVKKSDIYDKKLKMYKLNEPLENTSFEIGRVRAFLPGWLENESIFLHMEYKYLLEMLKTDPGYFFYDMMTCLVPFMDPKIYKRSIFENVSFIVSSANPDPSIHGAGFSARLSGSTAELYNILLLISLGKNPFYLDENKKLIFKLEPSLPSFLFTEKDEEVEYYSNGKVLKIFIPQNSYVIRFLDDILIYYINPIRSFTFGDIARGKIKEYILYPDLDKDEKIIIKGDKVPEPYSKEIREGKYKKIEVILE
ncbi:MAG: hypothetical protein NZ841_06195 [Dictyoglomus sp.]|nr:hypothetical protein [Dictyoglomus sp.]MDW8188868.1 hypothetical protein [Dictyoglomus sp.]